MSKRVLSLFMVLVLCLTLLPTAAFAEGEDVSISGGVIGGGETGGEGGGNRSRAHFVCGAAETAPSGAARGASFGACTPAHASPGLGLICRFNGCVATGG